MAWIALFMGALVLIGLIQLNVSYWRELKRMTPDEYRRFKDKESKDMQNW